MRNIFTLLILLISINSFAQIERCYTEQNYELYKKLDPQLESRVNQANDRIFDMISNGFVSRNSDNLYVIPTVIHILWNDKTENLSDNLIKSQMRVLNEDFRKMLGTPGHNNNEVGANTNIVFRLASIDPNGNPTTGITRTQSPHETFNSDEKIKFTANGGIDAWPTDKYLNIWVCNIDGLLGWATYPGFDPAYDGVVILSSAFGYGSSAAPYDKGRTGTHEVGHWFHLHHIWGDGDCTASDEVADTPDSDGPNFGCPVGHISCDTEDMIENYMDYTDDDCMNIFTQGQADRMAATIATSRPDIITSYPFNTLEYNLSIVETDGGRQTITFGFDPSATNGIDELLGEVGQAATIEDGYFDARFIIPDRTSTTLMDLRPGNVSSAQWEINLKSSKFPLTLNWNSSEFYYGKFFLQSDGNTINVDMSTQSSLVISDSQIETLFIVGLNDLVPVELTSFNANVNGPAVSLIWQTATETNNNGFEIERLAISNNIRSYWERIGAVQGAGTTTENKSYSFSDNLATINADKVIYRLKQIDYDGTYTYSNEIEVAVVPAELILEQNYPNPFNPATTIRFSLPSDSRVKLNIYNSIGEEVISLVDGIKNAGYHEVNFDASKLSSGVYIYEISASSINGSEKYFRDMKKMILLR